MKNIIKEYYDQHGQKEWRRLFQDAHHQLEFNTSLKFIKKYLRRKKLKILDAGGGPGRYTIALAKSRHRLTLVDISPNLLQIAKKQIKRAGVSNRIDSIFEGSVTDLRWFSDNSFDAALCLGGVLSHLLSKNKRNLAIKELKRVTKKNGYIFISVIGRLAVLKGELAAFPKEIEDPDCCLRIAKTGNYFGGYGFAPTHFFLAEELKDLLEANKLQILEMVGLEGLAAVLRDATNRLAKNKKAWRNWLKVHNYFCTYPSVVDNSEHFMAICRKK